MPEYSQSRILVVINLWSTTYKSGGPRLQFYLYLTVISEVSKNIDFDKVDFQKKMCVHLGFKI